jgi:transposase InsO family protein
VEDRTRDGRKLNSADAIDVLADLFIAYGIPGHIRSDNGPEFVATAVKGWITGVGARTAYIEPRSPWENGYVERFNGKPRLDRPQPSEPCTNILPGPLKEAGQGGLAHFRALD